MSVFRHSGAALSALIAAPIGAGLLAVRPSWRAGLAERIGSAPRCPRGAVWIHGASVGEILAATRLVESLRKDGHTVITSTVTVAGRDVMRRLRPEVPCHLAPLDHPWCVDAALERRAPTALVLIETELWPCWIAAAERRGIPVVLVSGRLSDRSYPRYRRIGGLAARTLERIRAIGARTAVDRERFISLGAEPSRVTVSGDLKLEVEATPRPAPADLEQLLSKQPVWIAGSTHPGEEGAALAAQGEVERAGLSVRLVIAPRHPERAGEVARVVRSTGRRPRRRSRLGVEPLARDEVLIVDTLGELASLYGLAELAFVGGSLASIGGHNVLEPVLARRPVLYGRHTHDIRHAVDILQASGAGIRLIDARELGDAVIELLRDPVESRRRGEAGWHALQRHRGSAERAAILIGEALESAGPPGRAGR